MTGFTFQDNWSDEFEVYTDGAIVILDLKDQTTAELSPKVAQQVAQAIKITAERIKDHGVG